MWAGLSEGLFLYVNCSAGLDWAIRWNDFNRQVAFDEILRGRRASMAQDNNNKKNKPLELFVLRFSSLSCELRQELCT